MKEGLARIHAPDWKTRPESKILLSGFGSSRFTQDRFCHPARPADLPCGAF